jgi:hypothetical protein
MSNSRPKGKVAQRESPKSLWQNLKGKVFRMVRIFSPIFVCGLLIGYGLGKHWSRNYDDPAEIARYVAANVKPSSLDQDVRYEEQYTDFGQPSTLKPKDSEVYFDCEITRYSYSQGKPPVLKGITERVPKTHRNDLDFGGALTLLYGSVEGMKLATQFPKFLDSVEKYKIEERAELFAAGAVALASGVGLGIELGYEDSPNCASKAFSDNLSKPEVWQSIYGYYIENHSMSIVYDDLGFPRIDNSRGIGAILSSNKRSDLITAISVRPQFRSVEMEYLRLHFWLPYAISDVDDGHVPRFWIRENQLDPRSQWSWEQVLREWSWHHGPVAARILKGKRFKGDVMVVLRMWTVDKHDHVHQYDFVSSPSTQDALELEKELNSLNWETSKFYLPIDKSKLFDMNF